MRRLLLSPLTAAIVMVVGLAGCAGAPPKHLRRGVDEFTPCPRAPHCVSSQARPDSGRYVAPFTFASSAAGARQALLKALYASDGATVEKADDRFIHATFRTTLGFVDDVSFIIQPQASRIDVKSASRIGYYDFGVNRRRVEALRKRFDALLDPAA